eukprot:TRINITY_DN6236_c1_g3_i2.p1 TRINITY_DN6236_c1_g3~~TRINITY_DN6236_c1_g3_i2.p1  ORF type:complete len:435 (+),score=130.78 TRINITY_DN6236_c1_g3_i2:91-1305(+)
MRTARRRVRGGGRCVADAAVSDATPVPLPRKVVTDDRTSNPFLARNPRRLQPEHECINAWRSSVRQDPMYDPFRRLAVRQHQEVLAEYARSRTELPADLRDAILLPSGTAVRPSAARNGAVLGTATGFFLALGTASAALWWYFAELNAEPVKPRQGPRRFDPVLLARCVELLVRNVDPEKTAALVSLGVHVAAFGLTADAAESPAFELLRQFKEQHSLVSWADLSGFVAFVALVQMGAPFPVDGFRFGRLDPAVRHRAASLAGPPDHSASAADVRSFFLQFGLTDPEAVALLGGVPEGSLVLGDQSTSVWIDNSYHRRVLAAEQAGGAVPWSRALLSDELRGWTEAFAEDGLRFHKHFGAGCLKMLESGWDLKAIPESLSAAGQQQRPSSWQLRRDLVYNSRAA